MYNHRMVVVSITVTAIWASVVTACATRQDASGRHPYANGRMFQAPVIQLENYKSVQTRPKNHSDLAVLVSISGGGERAANLGVGVLLGLEGIRVDSDWGSYNALQEVDYFSTVSGGGMAAAAYLSAMQSYAIAEGPDRGEFSFRDAMGISTNKNISKDCDQRNVNQYYSSLKPRPLYDPCLRRDLERGYHSDILELDPEVIFTDLDRGDRLEDTFAKEILGGNWNKSDLSLDDLFILSGGTAKAQYYPQWVTNATVVENGAIFPFTPYLLARYQVIEYVHRMKYVNKGSESYAEFAAQIPLAVGLTASGNFPSLIAAQTLSSDFDPENSYLHLIDGGVSDNLGLSTAISILNQQEESVTKKLLIVVDAYPGTFQPFSNQRGSPNFLQVYLKLPGMPLDGLRSRTRERLDQLENSNCVKVIYLSFDDLFQQSVDDHYAEDPEEVEKLFVKIMEFYPTSAAESTDGSIAELRRRNREMSPFQIGRKVATSYNITVAEQNFLIAVGEYLIGQKKSEISTVMRRSNAENCST